MGAGTPTQGQSQPQGKGGMAGALQQFPAAQYSASLANAPVTAPVPGPQSVSPTPMPTLQPSFAPNPVQQPPSFQEASFDAFPLPQLSAPPPTAQRPQMYPTPPSSMPPMFKQFSPDMGYGRGLGALQQYFARRQGGMNRPYGNEPRPAEQLGAALQGYFDRFRG